MIEYWVSYMAHSRPRNRAAMDRAFFKTEFERNVEVQKRLANMEKYENVRENVYLEVGTLEY